MIGEIRSLRDQPTPLSVVVCGLLCALAAMIQVGFLNQLPILGAGAELVLAVVCLIGWRRGTLCAAVGGVVGGYVLDSLCTTGLSLSPFLMLIGGVFMSMIVRRLLDHPLTYALSLLPPMIVVGLERAIRAGRVKVFFGVWIGVYLMSAVVYLPRCLRRRSRSFSHPPKYK